MAARETAIADRRKRAADSRPYNGERKALWVGDL